MVTLGGQITKLAIQVASLIVFSRLLDPTDFGLVAMVTVFIALGELVRDFGLTQATLQTPKLSKFQASNAFWVNCAIGACLFFLLMAFLPLIEALFSEPELSEFAPMLGIVLILNAAQAQFLVRLARDGAFFTLTATDVTAQLTGFTIGLTCALSGFGYWSLVAQTIAASSVLLVTRVYFSKWLPGAPTRGAKMGPLYRFGAHLGIAQLLDYSASNTDTYAIGMRWNAAALGIYSRAFQLVSVPVSQLIPPLTNILLPLLSRQRTEQGTAHGLLLKALWALGLGFSFPFAVTSALSTPLVEHALGSEWATSGRLVGILLVGGMFKVMGNISYWAFLTAGLSRELLQYNLISKPLLAASVLIGSIFGLEGVAWGYSLGVMVTWPMALGWLRVKDRLPWMSFLSCGGQVVLSGMAAWGATRVAMPSDDLASLGSLLVAALAGAGAFMTSALLLPGSRGFLIEVSRSALNAKRPGARS